MSALRYFHPLDEATASSWDSMLPQPVGFLRKRRKPRGVAVPDADMDVVGLPGGVGFGEKGPSGPVGPARARDRKNDGLERLRAAVRNIRYNQP